MATIILTGAGGNLGISVKERLLNDGYKILAVTGSAGPVEPQGNALLESISLDLLDDTKTREFVESSIKKNSDIQAAVLLVGGFAMGKLSETTPEMMDKMIRLNFNTAFYLVRHLMPHFLGRPEGGQIILIGSRPGMDASEGKNFFAYSLSKSMIFKLADFINTEGKGKNVSATVIVPATIDTPVNRQAMPEADYSGWVPPGNIADAISFTLSETGRMMRETIIKIYNEA